MKLNNIIRKVFLTSLGLTLTLYSSFGSGIFSSSLLRRTSPTATTYVAQTALINSVRFCSTLPKGFKLIEISQEGLAPWSDKKQTSHSEESKPIDVTKFCADRERGLLYQFQSWKELETEKEEKFPLFKTKLETFDRCSDHQELSDLLESMGLVESFFDLESGQLRALGTGLMIRPDAVLTAAHNLTIDPEDSPKVKKSTNAKDVGFLLKYDSGKPLKTLRVSGYKVPNEWLFGRDAAYDFAVLFLENSEMTPKIKLASIEKWMDLPISTRVAGYPKEILEKSGLRVINRPLSSYAHSGEIKNISDCNRFLNYNCFTEEGMSGGPILIRDLPTVSIGVHTTGRWDLNRGVHHTDHMVGYLNKWFSEHKESNQIEDEDILKKIKELSKSDEEKEYLISNIHVIREYPRENTRAYLGFMLHTFRSRK
jgi:V8-like Glu-specific endopeptidase